MTRSHRLSGRQPKSSSSNRHARRGESATSSFKSPSNEKTTTSAKLPTDEPSTLLHADPTSEYIPPEATSSKHSPTNTYPPEVETTKSCETSNATSTRIDSNSVNSAVPTSTATRGHRGADPARTTSMPSGDSGSTTGEVGPTTLDEHVHTDTDVMTSTEMWTAQEATQTTEPQPSPTTDDWTQDPVESPTLSTASSSGTHESISFGRPRPSGTPSASTLPFTDGGDPTIYPTPSDDPTFTANDGPSTVATSGPFTTESPLSYPYRKILELPPTTTNDPYAELAQSLLPGATHAPNNNLNKVVPTPTTSDESIIHLGPQRIPPTPDPANTMDPGPEQISVGKEPADIPIPTPTPHVPPSPAPESTPPPIGQSHLPSETVAVSTASPSRPQLPAPLEKAVPTARPPSVGSIQAKPLRPANRNSTGSDSNDATTWPTEETPQDDNGGVNGGIFPNPGPSGGVGGPTLPSSQAGFPKAYLGIAGVALFFITAIAAVTVRYRRRHRPSAVRPGKVGHQEMVFKGGKPVPPQSHVVQVASDSSSLTYFMETSSTSGSFLCEIDAFHPSATSLLIQVPEGELWNDGPLDLMSTDCPSDLPPPLIPLREHSETDSDTSRPSDILTTSSPIPMQADAHSRPISLGAKAYQSLITTQSDDSGSDRSPVQQPVRHQTRHGGYYSLVDHDTGSYGPGSSISSSLYTTLSSALKALQVRQNRRQASEMMARRYSHRTRNSDSSISSGPSLRRPQSLTSSMTDQDGSLSTHSFMSTPSEVSYDSAFPDACSTEFTLGSDSVTASSDGGFGFASDSDDDTLQRRGSAQQLLISPFDEPPIAASDSEHENGPASFSRTSEGGSDVVSMLAHGPAGLLNFVVCRTMTARPPSNVVDDAEGGSSLDTSHSIV